MNYHQQMTTTPTAVWAEALDSFSSFVSSVEDWTLSSPCPGWSISDLIAHAIDLESLLADDARPEHVPDWSMLTHIDSDFGRLTEIGVDYRRGHSRTDLLQELQDTHARALLRVQGLGDEASIPWLRGETPMPVVLGLRTFDLWMHEQDARIASNSIGNLDGPGSQNVLEYMSAGLPKLWAKVVKADVGSVLHLAVTEPGLTGDYWVGVDATGRGVFTEPSDADVEIRMPWMTFVMLGGGRNTGLHESEAVAIVGNEALGSAFVSSMAMTP